MKAASIVVPGPPSPSRKAAVTNAVGALIRPLDVVSKNANRCSPTSKTVVARIGIMAAGSAGAVVGRGAAVGAAEEPHATNSVNTTVAKAKVISRAFVVEFL